ncbi:MAG TPA: hypothetical protein VGY56_10750 [Verrucomicrobiae bacterium]|nr:hypothetical protein [Verrucomicrobiae bacterium]
MPAQLSNEWSIQLLNPNGSTAGAPETLESLGIDSATFDFNNMAADVLTLRVGGLNVDASVIWNMGQLMALLKPDGTRFFVGRVEPWSQEGTPDEQNHFGRITNPWWYLANKIYQQRYNIPVFNNNAQIVEYNSYHTPRTILYVLYNGAPQNGQPATGFYAANNGQQIADAVNWAIAQGAPIQLGTVDPATTPPSHQQKGMTCEQVIKHAFMLEPDFVVDWDYTTLPFPTIHFRKQQSLRPLVIDLTTPGVREMVTVKARQDWQRSYVAIFYDETQSVGGQQYISLGSDVYPDAPPPGISQTEYNFRGVDLFCDLSGEKVGSQSQQANFASIAFDITSLATWTKWKPHLSPVYDPTITNVIIMTATTTPAADNYRLAPGLSPVDQLDSDGNPIALDPTCVYEVTEGSWADWIPQSNAQIVRATAYAYVVHKAAPGQNPRTEFVPLAHDFTAVNINTNGISKSFTQPTGGGQYAEPQPVGLAKQMWTSWQNLALEGSFQNKEAVIGATQPISRSNCLNFKTANNPAWATANATIQKMSGDILNGVTEVKFGAPLFLTGNELIDAIRWTRFRIETIDLAYIFGGAITAGAGTTRMARKHHARDSQHGPPQKMIEQISPAPDPSNPASPDQGGVITLDPTITFPQGTQAPPAPQVAMANQAILQAWQANATQPPR